MDMYKGFPVEFDTRLQACWKLRNAARIADVNTYWCITQIIMRFDTIRHCVWSAADKKLKPPFDLVFDSEFDSTETILRRLLGGEQGNALRHDLKTLHDAIHKKELVICLWARDSNPSPSASPEIRLNRLPGDPPSGPIRRLYVTTPVEHGDGKFWFTAGVVEADWESICGTTRSLCNPAEAGFDGTQNTVSLITLELLNKVAQAVGGFVTTLGEIYEEEPLPEDGPNLRVLLDWSEEGSRFVAVERVGELFTTQFVRDFGPLASPTVLCSSKSVDIDVAVPVSSPTSSHRVFGIDNLEWMMEDQDIQLGIMSRHDEDTFPLGFLARDQAVVDTVFRCLRSEPNFVLVKQKPEGLEVTQDHSRWIMSYQEAE